MSLKILKGLLVPCFQVSQAKPRYQALSFNGFETTSPSLPKWLQPIWTSRACGAFWPCTRISVVLWAIHGNVWMTLDSGQNSEGFICWHLLCIVFTWVLLGYSCLLAPSVASALRAIEVLRCPQALPWRWPTRWPRVWKKPREVMRWRSLHVRSGAGEKQDTGVYLRCFKFWNIGKTDTVERYISW